MDNIIGLTTMGIPFRFPTNAIILSISYYIYNRFIWFSNLACLPMIARVMTAKITFMMFWY